jgi:hypothetical protein
MVDSLEDLPQRKMTIVKVDPKAQSVHADPETHIVRVDGIILCKRVTRAGKVVLQFKDGDRMRSQCRGTAFVEVPLDAFREALLNDQTGVMLEWPY